MSDDLSDHQPRRERSTGRTGITLGILVAVLIALLFFFFWRSTGAREPDGSRPPAPVVR
ncbi:MAG TPA: hypothetical protein VFS05_15485 [Gemmatimonadaceae bacterium]|nr:hypothetical protein [Gemmatimonadaceae bacterium]